MEDVRAPPTATSLLRFGLEYSSSDGDKKRPIMIHRAIFGSLERFFGVLIESTAGDFPFWIAP